MSQDATRAALRAAHLQYLAAETAELHAVAAARAAGVTWRDIAEDLGYPAEQSGNVHRKYAKRLTESRAVEVKPDTGI